MSPERVLEHAETVRELHRAECKLGKLETKIERGHDNLVPFRERLTTKLIGGAA